MFFFFFLRPSSSVLSLENARIIIRIYNEKKSKGELKFWYFKKSSQSSLIQLSLNNSINISLISSSRITESMSAYLLFSSEGADVGKMICKGFVQYQAPFFYIDIKMIRLHPGLV